MKHVCAWLIWSVMLAGLAVPAHAATKLVTPRIVSANGDTAACHVVNAGTKPITVTVEMVTFDGSTLAGPTQVTLEPDHSTSIISPGFHAFHCIYTGTFSKKAIRANATVQSEFRSIVSVNAE
jgi:hypothetical protein